MNKPTNFSLESQSLDTSSQFEPETPITPVFVPTKSTTRQGKVYAYQDGVEPKKTRSGHEFGYILSPMSFANLRMISKSKGKTKTRKKKTGRKPRTTLKKTDLGTSESIKASRTERAGRIKAARTAHALDLSRTSTETASSWLMPPTPTPTTSGFGGAFTFGFGFQENKKTINLPCIKGSDDPSKFLISAKGKPVNSCRYTLDQVLSGCYKYKGKLDTSIPSSVEICFAFDCTGSMFSYLEEVRKKMQQIIETLLTDIPSIRISIIAHSDYCDYNFDSGVMKILDFTNSLKDIQEFLGGCVGGGGGDSEENQEHVFLEAQNLSWSDSAKAKCLVVIGDEISHAKNEYFGLDWKEEIQNLVKKGIRMYGVQANNIKRANDFYQYIADANHGSKINLGDMNSITEIFIGLCYREESNWRLEQQSEAINKLKLEDNKHAVLLPKTNNKDEILEDDDILLIHQAIHDPKKPKTVTIEGTSYEISVGKSGCRFARIKDITYIEQNKEKKTRYAKLALQGKKITWIVRSGNWGLIIDNAIEKHGSA